MAGKLAYQKHGTHLSDIVSLAFRLKIRKDALEAQSESDPDIYEAKVRLGRDIAEVLRKNVVQAHKLQQSENDKEIWRMSHFFRNG